MSKKLKILSASLAVILMFAIGLGTFALPALLKKYFTAQIKENCKSCEFSSEGIKFRLLPNRLIFKGLRLTGGNAKNTLVEANVERLVVNFSIRQLMNRMVKIRKVSFEHPRVVVTEGDEKTAPSPESTEVSSWDLEIDHIDLNEGFFTYHREHLGTRASLRVASLKGTISALGSSPSRRDAAVNAHVTGVLEETGSLDLTVVSPVFAKKLQVDVWLDLMDMTLDKVNSYFIPDSGTKLTGALIHGKAEVVLRGRTIKSKVHANYLGLDIKFRKTKERGALTTLASNLFSGVKPAKNRSRTASTDRNPEEPLVGFIFRGMRDAALKVATD